MSWIISFGISIIVLIIGNMLFSFFRDLNKDNFDLRGQTLAEKFNSTVDILNLTVFNGRGKIIPLDKRGFNLYEDGQNQIIHFEYSTGILTITWKYKYFQKEVVHEKLFRDVRNISLFEQQKIAEEMINEMSMVVENHKKNVLAPQGMDGMVDFHKGIARYNRQDYLGAISDYSKALDNMDTTNTMAPIIYHSRGKAKMDLCDYSGAITDDTKAIELNNDYMLAYYNRGLAKYALKDYTGAIADYTKVVEIDPKCANGYYDRGVAKIELGQKDSGCLDLRKAGGLGLPEAAEVIKKFCLLAPQGKGPTLENISERAAITNENLKALNDVQLTTFSSFTDHRDGNVYKTVKIGNQIWMAENLRYIPYIYQVDEARIWVYDYNGHNIKNAISSKNYIKYGCLYDWETAKIVCPTGWHLPSYGEWNILINYLGGLGEAGGKLKSISGWEKHNVGATNEFGFSALPGGNRNKNGTFNNIGSWGYWWSATERGDDNAWGLILDFLEIMAGGGYYSKLFGSSIRCIRN